jgi:ribonucleotide monophosphatase NagD (HAD superfamily)
VGGLTGIETVRLDLDGTLYVGSQAVPGGPLD